jgi:fatty acid desaturase
MIGGMAEMISNASRILFRNWQDAFANTLILLATSVGWLASFWLMVADSVILNVVGALLCAYTMVLAAYLVHEAAHQTLFAIPGANHWVGEAMNFVAGSSYASFGRIRHMHMRHHLDRADLTCFDFKGLLQRHPAVRKMLQVLEWAYIPATEILMHMQVICRPLFVRSQRRHLPRVIVMLAVRSLLLAWLWSLAPKAVLLYALAVVIELHVLNFFDGFHHTFEQYVVIPEEPISSGGRDRGYEQSNTYSNLISRRHAWLNALAVNFGYHNVHHHRPSVPWWRLPELHRKTYGDDTPAVMPLREILWTWHRNRVRRVFSEDYGAPQTGPGRADSFIGAHGVSFLTVV